MEIAETEGTWLMGKASGVEGGRRRPNGEFGVGAGWGVSLVSWMPLSVGETRTEWVAVDVGSGGAEKAVVCGPVSYTHLTLPTILLV